MRRQRRVNVKCICLRHETVLLFSMSRDWDTVQNVVQGNSSMKPDQTGVDGQGVKQSEMFNYSVYSRLGNNPECLTEFSNINRITYGYSCTGNRVHVYLYRTKQS